MSYYRTREWVCRYSGELFKTSTEYKHFQLLWIRKMGYRYKEECMRNGWEDTMTFQIANMRKKAGYALEVYKLERAGAKYRKELAVRTKERELFIKNECKQVIQQIENLENQIEKLKLGIDLCKKSLKHHEKEATVKYKKTAKPWNNQSKYNYHLNKIRKLKSKMQ